MRPTNATAEQASTAERLPFQPIWLATLGAVHTLAYVHTRWGWCLSLLALFGLVAALARQSPWRAAALAWSFGTGWLCAGVWWLFISMHRYGGLSAPLAGMAVLALAAVLSLYLAAAGWAFARWRSGRPGWDACLWAALWLLAELARGRLFTGFPWVASGYAFVDAPLGGLAPYVGVYGIGALAAGSAAWAALTRADRARGGSSTSWALALRHLRPWLALGLLLAAASLLGRIEHTRPAGSLQVTLIQTNVAQDEKFATERLPQALAWLGERLQRAGGDLVIAPETAIPLLPDQLEALSPGYWAALQAHFGQAGRAALVGLPLGDFASGYTNSVAGLSPGAHYRYDKQHLVPFGEFIPPGFRWFVDMLQIPLGDFSRGPLDAPSFEVLGQRVGPNVCYEDLFGEELAVRFVQAERAPTLLANVSNIGWFGDTVALPQHLNISRMRTLELQRPMLRATNTGVTAIVDHRGRVLARMEPFSAGALSGRVEGREGVTPYAAWVGRFGLWPLGLLAMLVVVLMASRRAP